MQKAKTPAPLLASTEKVARKKKTIQSLKAKANAKRTFTERIADGLTSSFGTISFLFLNAIFFAVWILWNMGLIPDLSVFDPYPFSFLTLIVSLEAIFLAIVVLISQNRASKVAELREEMELYVNLYSENEITKMIHLQTLLLAKHGIDISKDKELQTMLKDLPSERIEQELESQL